MVRLSGKRQKISTASSQKPRKLKFSFKEQQEFEAIDDDIAALEAQIVDCTHALSKAASDYVRLQELTAQLDMLKAALEAKTERWVYLNELAEKIGAQ